MAVMVSRDRIHGGSPAIPEEPIWRLTVEQYHRMIQARILTEDDRIELLDGWLVAKMVKNPAHETSARLVRRALERIVPAGWDVDKERPVTIVGEESEPEPDIVVVRGVDRTFVDHHPGPQDVALVVEIADSSLARDRGVKKRLYAAAGIPVYWIVNLTARQVESYTLPSGPGARPEFGRRDDHREEDAVPLLLAGEEVALLLVKDLLP